MFPEQLEFFLEQVGPYALQVVAQQLAQTQPLLKKKRWCLLKRPENLTDKQRLSLRELLGYNLKSVRAYLLKEEFQLFWEYDSPTWAAKFLDAWCTRAMRSRIEPVKRFVRTVRAHRELLLNYFKAKKRFSSGIIEGLNNKAKGHAEQVLASVGALVWDGLQGANHSHSPAMARICNAADRPKQG